MTKKEFLATVEKFLKETKMAPTTFGTKSLEDPMFVLRLRDGRECREETQNKVLKFIKNYKEKANG